MLLEDSDDFVSNSLCVWTSTVTKTSQAIISIQSDVAASNDIRENVEEIQTYYSSQTSEPS